MVGYKNISNQIVVNNTLYYTIPLKLMLVSLQVSICLLENYNEGELEIGEDIYDLLSSGNMRKSDDLEIISVLM